jgi:hypothetical protein
MACGKRRLEDLCSDPWAIQAENDAEHFISKFFRFDKLQLTGKLSESGDQMDVTFFVTFFDDAETRSERVVRLILKAYAFRWIFCPTPLLHCPFPLFPPLPQRRSSDRRIMEG